MADITKCTGENCPIKEMCYRFTAKEDELYQSYFTETPGKLENNTFSCDMYWGEESEGIYKNLKDIMKGGSI